MQKHRKAFYMIQRALVDYNVVILVGLRKTGKTTILKQLADDMNGLYIDFRSDSNEDRYIHGLKQSSHDLLLLDEVCYMQDFDLVLSTADVDCYNNNKRVVLTSSSYGSLSQLAMEQLGGGRSCVIELFPLSFEEYLYFSNKIYSYGEEYIPSETDVENFYSLDGIPPQMKFVFDSEYLESIITEADVATANYYNEQRDYLLNTTQVKAALDVIAYTLNYKVNMKRFGATRVGVQEYNISLVKDMNLADTLISKSNDLVNINEKITRKVNNIQPKDVSSILLFLLNNGFLFVDLVRDEHGLQNISEVVHDLLLVNDRLDLTAVLKKYVFSPISPLLYTRLKLDLESAVGYPAINSHLRGDMFELAIKSEDVYNSRFRKIHFSEKVKYGDNVEVDLYSYDGVLLESAIGVKLTNNLLQVMRDVDIVRVLTRPVDGNDVIIKENGYYSIQYPMALLMLSNKSIYELDTSVAP